MADQVVTQFILDTQQYDAALKSATAGMTGYDKATEAAIDENKKMSGSLGNTGKKFKETEAIAKGAGKGVKDFGASTKGSGQLVSNFRGQLDSTFPVFGKIASGAKLLGTSIYAALGPIGIVIGAVVLAFGALVKIFAGTQEGMNRISAVVEPLKAQFSALIGLLQTVGKAAADTVALLFNVATADFDGIVESFDALKSSASQAGSEISNFGDTLAEAGEKGARLAEIKLELDAVALSIAENESRINREFQEQYAIAGNVAASAEERRAAAEKAIALQKELTALKIAELDILIEQKKIEQSLNDTTNEEKIELAKLIAQREEVRAAEVAANRRVQNTINTLDKEATTKAAAELKKRAAAAKKAREKEIKEAEALAKATAVAEGKVEAVVAEAQRARELSALSASEREVAILEDGFKKKIDATKAAFEALNALEPEGAEGDAARAENARLEAETLLNIQDELNEEKEALRQRDLENVRAALLSEQELQREAINKEQDALAEEIERLYEAGEERTAILEQIEVERAERLGEIRTEAQEAELEALKAKQDQQVALITGVGNQLSDVSKQLAEGQIATAKDASKALVGVAIDSVGAIVNAKIVELFANLTADGAKLGPVGAAAGLAAGGVFSGILQGLLNKLKSSLTGAYTGERNIGSGSEAPTWEGRDGYIRRVHKGEDIIAADKTKRYRGALDRIHDGSFEKWIAEATIVNTIAREGNTYVEARSSNFNDSRMVGALGGVGSVTEQRRQTALLARIASNGRPNRNKRVK